jgi:hypothetical protein
MKITKENGQTIASIGLVVFIGSGFFYFMLRNDIWGVSQNIIDILSYGIFVGLGITVIGAILGTENLYGRIIGFGIFIFFALNILKECS